MMARVGDQRGEPEPGAADGPMRRRLQAFGRIPLAVHAAALLFAATMVGFLLLYPTFYGFDEPQHVDRIYATTDGELLPDPGGLPASQGIARAQNLYVESWPYLSDHSYVDETEIPRGERPSLSELGGHSTEPPGGYSNQLSEHPPAYYWLLGGVMWLVPGDASLPVDLYVDVLRGLNILLVLPVPYLLWWGVRKLTGEGPAASAAAFVPVLIPGLSRLGASVNNDNLVILTSTALLALVAGITKGDFSSRTARWVAVLLALSLLTKGTTFVLPVVVAIAFVVGWARVRGRPPWRPFLVSAAGSALGGLWWVANLLRFGEIRPSGWGERLVRVQGPPRSPDDPAQLDLFFDYVGANLPSRFWGGLGLIEPPQLPAWSVATLGWVLLGTLLVTLVAARRNRASVLVLWFGLAVTVAVVLLNSWSHYERFTVIPGVQGRYAYAFLLPVAAALAMGLSLVLGRFRRATPLVLLGVALVTQFLAVEAVVAHIWLPTGQLPRPGNIGLAFETIARFAPFPTVVTASLAILIAAAGVAAVVLAGRGVLTRSAETASARATGERPVDRATELQSSGVQPESESSGTRS